jgi:hypothetical protein
MDAVAYIRKVQKERENEEVSVFGAMGVKQPVGTKDLSHIPSLPPPPAVSSLKWTSTSKIKVI